LSKNPDVFKRDEVCLLTDKTEFLNITIFCKFHISVLNRRVTIRKSSILPCTMQTWQEKNTNMATARNFPVTYVKIKLNKPK